MTIDRRSTWPERTTMDDNLDDTPITLGEIVRGALIVAALALGTTPGFILLANIYG